MLSLALSLLICTKNVHAIEIEDPKILRDALKRNPRAEKEFLAGQAAWQNGKWDESIKMWRVFLKKAHRRYGNGHIITESAAFYLGDTYRQSFDLEHALPLLERASKTFVRLIGSHPDTAQSLNNLAAIHIALEQHDKALPLQQHAFAILENIPGVEKSETLSLYTALSLFNLAKTYVSLEKFDKALLPYQRALVIFDKKLGPEHPISTNTTSNLALIYSHLFQYNNALSLHQRTLAIHEKNLGSDHFNTATALSNLAATYVELGQYNLALPLQIRALAIYEKNLGYEHPDLSSILGHTAGTYVALGEYEKALPLQKRAFEISQKILGPEHPNTATDLGNLAGTYAELGQYDLALSLQIRVLKIIEKTIGSEHIDTSIALNSLAVTYAAIKQLDKALPLQLRALEIREKKLGPNHPDTGVILNNLAKIHDGLAAYQKSILLHQQNLAITENFFGTEHPKFAISLGNLALTHAHLGQQDKALPLLQRSLLILEKNFGLDHRYTATALNNLALIHMDLLEYHKALPLQKKALRIMERSLGPEHPDTASALNNLASTYGALSKYEKALPLLHRALLIVYKNLGSDNENAVASLLNLADIHLKLKESEISIIFFKSVINIYQSQRERISKIGTSELQSYTQSVSSAYQVLASVLTDQGRLAEAQLVLDMLKENEQFEFIRRSNDADPRRNRIGYNTNEQAWVNRYRQIADQLAALGAEELALQKQAKLGLSIEQKQRQQAVTDDLVVARKAFESFLSELRDSFAKQGPARAVEVLETSQQALRETQALLKGLGSDTVLLQYYVTDDKVGMLLTTSGIQLARTTAIKSKELSRQIGEFRRMLRDPKANTLPAAQALYQLLLSPVEKDLAQAGAKNIMLSLDGPLRYLPFAALHDGKQHLVQRWNMPMYTSVTKSKLRDAVTPQWQVAGLGLTRAMGEFSALPAVKAEMSSIVRTGVTGVLPGEVYLDEAFNAARFKDVSQRKFQLLHVASHFQFSPGTEINSFLLLGDGQQLTLGDIRTQNYRFDNVDLLTLSACDTGLGGGRDAQGREIEGFGVIAQQQGAKAVLATLWPVADQSTATLMADMYKQRQEKNLTKIEALRQAQLSLLSQPKYAHPFYWAPFILMGNWK